MNEAAKAPLAKPSWFFASRCYCSQRDQMASTEAWVTAEAATRWSRRQERP